MKITNKKYKNLNLANEDDRGENLIMDFIISSFMGVLIAFYTYKKLPLAFLIYILVRFIYYFSFEYISGRTLGKYQTQTQVVNHVGEKPTVIQLIKRNISRFISILSGLSDDEKALHDNVSNTFVIKNEALKKIEFKLPLILLFNLIFFGFWSYYFWTKPKLETLDKLLLIIYSFGFIYSLIIGLKMIRKSTNNR
ncbi:RDD family protein [Olleya namhaensis]|uniref:RDD family protein n=1 Tax=Olleya namhaensis TaxID=1144750 RepID=UPI00232B855E|nr:RDD family protein [Olleya namhaensis]